MNAVNSAPKGWLGTRMEMSAIRTGSPGCKGSPDRKYTPDAPPSANGSRPRKATLAPLTTGLRKALNVPVPPGIGEWVSAIRMGSPGWMGSVGIARKYTPACPLVPKPRKTTLLPLMPMPSAGWSPVKER